MHEDAGHVRLHVHLHALVVGVFLDASGDVVLEVPVGSHVGGQCFLVVDHHAHLVDVVVSGSGGHLHIAFVHLGGGGFVGHGCLVTVLLATHGEMTVVGIAHHGHHVLGVGHRHLQHRAGVHLCVVAVHAVEFAVGGIHMHEDAGHVRLHVHRHALVVGVFLDTVGDVFLEVPVGSGHGPCPHRRQQHQAQHASSLNLFFHKLLV